MLPCVWCGRALPPARGGHLDPPCETKPLEVLSDRVVQRAKPAAVLLDQHPERVEAGLYRRLGLLGLDVAAGIVDRVGVGAVAVDPIVGAIGLLGRKNDVNFVFF